MLLSQLAIGRLCPSEPGIPWPIEQTLLDVPDRRVKQRIKISLFAHGMSPRVPAFGKLLESSPTFHGHAWLFDQESEDDVPPPPFFSLDIDIGSQRGLHLYCDDEGGCYTALRRGAWQLDVVRWATQHRDPIRLANLNLAMLLWERVRRSGQVNGHSARIVAPCYDDYGFGGELGVQFFRDNSGFNPEWPFVIPEDSEPESATRCSLYVMFQRRALFTCSWGFGSSGPVASVYSDLGHFHGPLLRWAESP
jgi:hypothetical protein